MNKRRNKLSKPFLLLVFLSICLTACNTKKAETDDSGSFFDDDTDRAIEYVQEANRNLQSIKALYNVNNPKKDELKTALKNNEIEKVKKIADELTVVMVDGYVFAKNAKEKLDEAKSLSGINETFRRYLELKSESLDLQIKAFDYWRDTAKLFRDEFNPENEKQMEAAKAKFIENEKKFGEYQAEAQKRNDEADKIWSESKRKK
jgi:uncharacterized protein YehS (DUF1456 family)